MSDDRYFPLSYEEVQGQWESRLFSAYNLCETGCGTRLSDHAHHIFCQECLEKFNKDSRALIPQDRQQWLDGLRREHLLMEGEQVPMWRSW